MNKDEVLKEAIAAAGYYEYEDVDCNLRNDDLPYGLQVSLVLARALKTIRPDLFEERNSDLVYVICNGEGHSNYTLPSLDLTSLMESQKPYDDAYIAVYSLSERKILSKLYKGDGTKWVLMKHKGD